MGAPIVSGDSDFLKLKAQMLEDSILRERLHQISIMVPSEAMEKFEVKALAKK